MNRAQRCPACGRKLKITPSGTYYCFGCRTHYNPEDIE